jgi:hypothetical protein
MKLCIPHVQGRGAGLGNELIPWSKGFLASAELGLRLLPPAFGFNRFGYRHYFGTTRFDWFTHRALLATLPTFRFGEEEYRSTGQTDFGLAVRQFARTHELAQRARFVFVVEGMWGGYRAIDRARPFVWHTLLRARGSVVNLAALQARIKPDALVVAVHVRLGDFAPPRSPESVRGRFAVRIPLDWYVDVCRAIERALRGRVQFLLFTDGSLEDVQPFVQVLAPVTTRDMQWTVCSDLLAMAQADILVSSLSSYSMCAAWLSGKPYLWYRPQLVEEGGVLSLWGAPAVDAACAGNGPLPADSPALPRGVPVRGGEDIPESLIEYLLLHAGLRQRDRDLVMHGCLPSTAPGYAMHRAIQH